MSKKVGNSTDDIYRDISNNISTKVYDELNPRFRDRVYYRLEKIDKVRYADELKSEAEYLDKIARRTGLKEDKVKAKIARKRARKAYEKSMF
ncbi:hypothetical protein ACVRYP_03165 [Streptococcus rifensis]